MSDDGKRKAMAIGMRIAAQRAREARTDIRVLPATYDEIANLLDPPPKETTGQRSS